MRQCLDAIAILAIGVAKEHKMEIFKVTTLMDLFHTGVIVGHTLVFLITLIMRLLLLCTKVCVVD